MSQLALDRSAPDDRAASRAAAVAEGRREAEVAPAEAGRVFISYSRSDMAFVDRLDAALRERGIEAAIDRQDIYAFEDWWRRIQGLIEQADTIVFALSPDSVSSGTCAKEVAFAASLNKRFAPVVVRAVDPATVPQALSRLNFVFLDGEAWAAGLDRLVDALTTDIGWVRQHSAYGAQAHRWAQEGRPASLLLSGRSLEDAQHWIAARPADAPVPTEETQALLIASRTSARTRRRTTTAALVTGFVLALGLAALALWQRQEALTQRNIAERNFGIARETIDTVIFDLAQGLREVNGIRVSVLKTVLSRAETAVGRLNSVAPDDVGIVRSRERMLIEFGDTYIVAGDTTAARAAYEQALEIARALLLREPDNTLWQRDVSLGLEKVGDVRLRSGDRVGALTAYQEALDIRRALAAREPDNTLWQRNVAVSIEKLGIARIQSGDAVGMLAAFQESVEIWRALVRREPEDTLWPRALSFALHQIGLLKLQTGDAAGALIALQEALQIVRALVRRDPDNTTWQRDVAIYLRSIGDLKLRVGDATGALADYVQAIDISRSLVRADGDNARWKGDLAADLQRIGDLKLQAGDTTSAHSAYQEALDILRLLLSRDDRNTVWQRDTSLALTRIGDVRLKAGNASGAMTAFQEALDIARALVRRDPDNPDSQGSVSYALRRIGNLRLSAGDAASALLAYEEGLEIDRSLSKRDPSNLQRQIDLAGALIKVAVATSDAARKRDCLIEALAILDRLDQSGRLPQEQKRWRDLVRTEITEPRLGAVKDAAQTAPK